MFSLEREFAKSGEYKTADSFCQKIRRDDFYKGQYYLDKEGLMCKQTGNFREDKLLIRHSLVNDVIKLHHGSLFAFYAGRQRTLRLHILRYWWPQMRKTVPAYIVNP